MPKKESPKEIEGRKLKPGENIFKGGGIKMRKTDGQFPYIETNIDKLYNMIKEKGSMKFYNAAIEFNTTKEQIVSWAGILEEHKLIKVHYPIFGSPVMFFREKEKKEFISEPEKKPKMPVKKMPKIGIALAGSLLVFFGYILSIANPFTMNMRNQITTIVNKITGIFGFLPYPLNIITPAAIIVIILWILAVVRYKRTKSLKTEKVKNTIKIIKKELR